MNLLLIETAIYHSDIGVEFAQKGGVLERRERFSPIVHDFVHEVMKRRPRQTCIKHNLIQHQKQL
jgi:hypothetical protein